MSKFVSYEFVSWWAFNFGFHSKLVQMKCDLSLFARLYFRVLFVVDRQILLKWNKNMKLKIKKKNDMNVNRLTKCYFHQW